MQRVVIRRVEFCEMELSPGHSANCPVQPVEKGVEYDFIVMQTLSFIAG